MRCQRPGAGGPGETSWDAPEGAHDPGPPDAPAGARSGHDGGTNPIN